MPDPLSPRARAELARQTEILRRKEQRGDLHEILEHCIAYLSPNSWLVFIGEERPSEELLQSERKGDAQASLERCKGWIRHGWMRARREIVGLGIVDRVEAWAPPTSIWVDVHPIFVRFLKNENPEAEVDQLAKEVSDLRAALGSDRYKLWYYFRWLDDEIEKDWPGIEAMASQVDAVDARGGTPSKKRRASASRVVDKRHELRPKERNALDSYTWLMTNLPDLTEIRRRNYAEGYGKLRDTVSAGLCPQYPNLGALPSQKTWERYVRKGLSTPDDEVTSPRNSRAHGSSIVEADRL